MVGYSPLLKIVFAVPRTRKTVRLTVQTTLAVGNKWVVPLGCQSRMTRPGGQQQEDPILPPYCIGNLQLHTGGINTARTDPLLLSGELPS